MGIYWGYFMGYKTHRMGPQDSVQLPYKWLNLLRFMVDTTIVNGVYKPTYNWGAPSDLHTHNIIIGFAKNMEWSLNSWQF